MVPLLRSCILYRKRLFAQEIISLKRVFVYSTCSDIKTQMPIPEGNNIYKSNKNDQRELVYNGTIVHSIRWIKGFSLVSSIISIVVQPILWMRMVEDDNTMSFALTLITINFIVMCNPLLVYLLTKRYVIDMHYYPKERKYVVQVFNFFFQKRKIEFTRKDVTTSKKGFELFTTFHAKNYPLLFDDAFSLSNKHYFILKGYKTHEDFEREKIEVPPVNILPVNPSNELIKSKKKIEQ